MTTVGSYEAKTHLPKLLQRIERGERIIITRRGLPIAMLSPPPRQEMPHARNVIRQMKALRKGNTLGKRMTLRDLIEEGRRF